MHALRHRFATRAYRGTRNLRAVQVLLGHESISTTERSASGARSWISRAAGHRELDRTEQTLTGAVCHRKHRRGLADIDSNDDRGRCDWSSLHRHNNTSGACQENPCAPTHGPHKESLTDPFLTPPEAYVKDQSTYISP
jgi:Phage integrase family